MAPPAPAIRLVVSDVDGTLVRQDKSLAPSTIAAAGRLRAAGIRLALVSSRPPNGLDALCGQLALDTPRAGFNGGLILGPDNRTLREHTIPEAACQESVTVMQQAGTDVWVFCGDRWLLQNPQGPHVPREHKATGLPFQVVDDFAPYLARVHKVMGASDDHDLVARLEAELRGLVGREAMVARSQSYYLDVTHPQANKGAAALALAALLDVEAEAMVCLGDMPNDVPMFEVAGLSIAMGNAPDPVKARAKAVTAGNDDDGWALAIDQYVLPRAPG
jgi:Cof subfamily protein (haloacid dehalogenase superfamily)